jgi:1-acyl-sn-glycerol-3-phosphate acyltransferase
LSETSTRIPHGKRRNAPQPEPFMLPQWSIEVMRPVARRLIDLLWRTRYVGLENIPLTGGVMIVANHQTYIDPFWVGMPVKRPIRFLAWSEAFSWPVVGKLMTLFGAWPLQVEGSDPAAIRRSLKWLRNGGAVVVFPEGGRGPIDGSLDKFKNGAVRMALEANVPILPVTLRGAHRIWPKGRSFPCLEKLEIIYHPLQTISPQPSEDTRACARRETKRLAEIIASAL